MTHRNNGGRRNRDTGRARGWSRQGRPRGALPAGAGGVACLACGATAAADGKGTPIVLRHRPGCVELVDQGDN